MVKLVNLEALVGLGFETEQELQSYIKSIYGVTSVSEIVQPDNDFSDEMVFLEVNDNEEHTLFIARGKSGRIYIIEVC